MYIYIYIHPKGIPTVKHIITCIKGNWAKMNLFGFNPKIGDPQLHSWLYDFDLSNEGLAVFREVLWPHPGNGSDQHLLTALDCTCFGRSWQANFSMKAENWKVMLQHVEIRLPAAFALAAGICFLVIEGACNQSRVYKFLLGPLICREAACQ